ncbi:glycosyltransferase [Candidatus Pacearchaeota archaeon]|nr:glycosyltransferase [Candidatus Pacearchaeota archaeon]
MNFIEFIFFAYMFIGLYMLNLLLFLYIPNRHRIFEYPNGKPEPVSIIMPCYNEGKHIAEALDALLAMRYPREMLEIIVVDDRSTDDSAAIVRAYARTHLNVHLIVNTRNSGGAAEPTNIGIKAAKHAYIAVADADSTPEPDALLKMIGFLQHDSRTAAVTCTVMSKEPYTFIQKLQAIEYAIIAWSRKLLDLVDAVYVTPGPFALYRKKQLLEVGLFDMKNMTQDIEIVWRLLSHGYVARMCLAARVHSATPSRFKSWFRQRVRWNIGGTQTLIKYRSMVFKKGMLGAFIIPFFSLSLFLGLIGLCVFLYLLVRRFLITYLSTKYSLYGHATLLQLQDLTFSPSILNFFGVTLFLAGSIFTLVGLGIMNQPRFTKGNIFNILFYMLVYLSVYPVIMITGLTRLIRGTYSW